MYLYDRRQKPEDANGIYLPQNSHTHSDSSGTFGIVLQGGLHVSTRVTFPGADMLNPNDVVAPTAHIVPPPLATATAPHERPFVSVAMQLHEVPRKGGCVPCTGAMCITQPVIRGGTYHIGMSAQSSMKTPTHQVSSFAPSLSIGALLRVITHLLTHRPCWQRLCGKMDGDRPQD